MNNDFGVALPTSDVILLGSQNANVFDNITDEDVNYTGNDSDGHIDDAIYHVSMVYILPSSFTSSQVATMPTSAESD